MKQLVSTLLMVFEFLLSAECRIWLRLLRRPAMVVIALFLMVALAAWLDMQLATHVAHAESGESTATTVVRRCLDGQTLIGDLCYPPCERGDTPVAGEPTCLKPCPPGHTPEVGTNRCRAPNDIFIKNVFVRTPATNLICTSNQENQAGLCYPRCQSGFDGAGPLCFQRCPSGYVDGGSTCRRLVPLQILFKQVYSRGAGTVPNGCANGMEKIGDKCFVRCAAGEESIGLICRQKCPAGYTDSLPGRERCVILTPFVERISYSRGPGVSPNAIPEVSSVTANTPINTPVNFATTAFDPDEADRPNLRLRFDNFANGTHTIVNGENVYTPNPGFAGLDTMRWLASDGKHDSNVATVTILVGLVLPNSNPLAIDRSVTVTEDTPITITVTCTDAENDPLFYQLIDLPQHGSYEWLPPNTVIYTPTANFVGVDTFTFQAHDGRDPSSVSTITLTVEAANDAPVAQGYVISTTRNLNAAINLLATDVESDTISYSLVTSPTHGTLSGAIPNLIYTPDVNFVGQDSLQFRASDPQGAASVATISISVLPANTAPLAESQVLTTEQESALAVNLSASDADGDALTYRVVADPANGSLSGEGAELIYRPNTGFIGTDSFTFKTNDGQADSPVTTVTIHVTAAPNEASVGGFVYEDRNGNGQPDGEDVGVAGLLVTLTPANGRANTTFSTVTEAGGGWRIDGVPFGSYTVKVTGGNGVQIEQPVAATLTVGQRGLQQLQPGAVKVTGRLLFLPVVVR